MANPFTFLKKCATDCYLSQDPRTGCGPHPLHHRRPGDFRKQQVWGRRPVRGGGGLGLPKLTRNRVCEKEKGEGERGQEEGEGTGGRGQTGGRGLGGWGQRGAGRGEGTGGGRGDWGEGAGRGEGTEGGRRGWGQTGGGDRGGQEGGTGRTRRRGSSTGGLRAGGVQCNQEATDQVFVVRKGTKRISPDHAQNSQTKTERTASPTVTPINRVEPRARRGVSSGRGGRGPAGGGRPEPGVPATRLPPPEKAFPAADPVSRDSELAGSGTQISKGESPRPAPTARPRAGPWEALLPGPGRHRRGRGGAPTPGHGRARAGLAVAAAPEAGRTPR